MTKTFLTPAALLLGVAVVLLPAAGRTAQDPATKAAIKCRKALAKKSVAALKGLLKRVDACHQKRDKGKSTPNCNAVNSPQGALAGAVRKACRKAPDVLANYATNDPAAAIAGALKTAVEGVRTRSRARLTSAETRRSESVTARSGRTGARS
jgi:hypothetical protein